MKKIILSLIVTALLCTMCMGFVACNSAQNIYNFAKRNEFSFGRFVEDELMEHRHRDYYHKRYDEAVASANAADPGLGAYPALFLVDDNYFGETINNMQEIYNRAIDEYIIAHAESYNESEKHALREQCLNEYTEMKKVAFGGYHWDGLQYTMVTDTDPGEKFEDDIIDTIGYVIKDEIQERLTFRYTISFVGEGAELGLSFDSFDMCFGIYILNENKDVISKFSGVLELFWYPEDSPESTLLRGKGYVALIDILSQISAEELYKLSKPYYDIMEEVVDAWLNDPRGQAYLNKYYRQRLL